MTIKGLLAKSDPASWLALLISILVLLQSSSTSPPSAEEIADAISTSGVPNQVAVPKTAGPEAPKKSSKATKRSPKTHGKAKQTKARKRR